jgi:hypothetical protein
VTAMPVISMHSPSLSRLKVWLVDARFAPVRIAAATAEAGSWTSISGRAVVIGEGDVLVVVLGIHEYAESDLLDVVQTGSLAGGSARLREDREEDGYQYRNDRDYNQADQST